MAANNKYWQDRFNMLQESQLNKGQKYYYELEKQYKQALSRIEKDISVWYQRFAINNEISFAEAKQMLSGKELKEFKWDVTDYIKYGEENAINQKWMKELENASARVHVSRLEALKIQTQNHIEVLYGNQVDGIDQLARNIYKDGYYHTAYEIQKGFNVGYDLQSLNEKQLSQVISKPWTADNKTFSDRCWTSRQQLINAVHTQLTQSILRGDSPSRAINSIAKQFNVSKNQAGRLIMTETAFFASAAQRDCFNSLDVERFEIVATLDNSTSEICRGLDGEIIPMKDFQPGVTAPPFHCWCRTVTVPYFEDDIGERAARGDDGKTYYVPSNMKYPEWKETFVDGGSKDGLNKINVPGTLKEPLKFVPATTMDEIKSRVATALGTDKINLGNMKVELGNQYLEGIETFTKDYPELNGFLMEVNTKTSPRAYGQFNILGTYVDERKNYNFGNSLSLRSPKDLEGMYSDYANDISRSFHYEGMSPKMTAIHECTHVLDALLTATENGAYKNKALMKVSTSPGISHYFGGYAHRIIEQAYIDVFGKRYGQEVYDGIKYLGKYALSNNTEMLAQCISYEYSGKTNKFSARVKELFDEKVKEVLKR